ncbi:MAG: efflux RND transporter periplasmic adaptor subunit [Deltaproteobacteria bacterium]|nr:MAG: efflux RND transporter periplasmic adaptor subunit [Deltaproteobacteria bacterium]
MRRAAIGIIAILIIGIVIYRGVSKKDKQIEEVEEERIIPVVVTDVKKGNIKEILYFTGDIKGQEEIDVFPRVAGKLLNNLVEEGDIVTKGTVIAMIDRDIAGMKFEPSEVTSPIAGILGKLYLDKGAGVNPPTMSPAMGTPIAMIVNMDKVKVVIYITEKYLPRVNRGQAAGITVDAYPDKVFQGTVTMLQPVVDVMNRTAKAEVTIPNPGHLLRPGMFARVNLIVAEKQGVIVSPGDAVLESPEGHFVFVEEEGVVEKRTVKTGIREEGEVEITEGLEPGERLVVVGQEMLSDGITVKVIE